MDTASPTQQNRTMSSSQSAASRTSGSLHHWTANPEPLYKAGSNPSGLDKQYAHKISLVWNPANDTWYMYYCAVGNQGRGIGLITSKPVIL
jgi:hypothetical protein